MHLETYLNDHLFGATAALELLQHLEETHPDLASFLSSLRSDIESDRQELEVLLENIGASPSTVRQAAGWTLEKLARLKLNVDDESEGELKLFESLEVLEIGVYGKGALWRVLQSVPAARGPNYRRLISRADEQRNRIEAARLAAARAAFD